MSNKVQSTCIICYTTWETDIQNRREKSPHNESLLRTFCRHFEIPLESIQSITWNFEEEPLPFCFQCQGAADRLVSLHQQLESIQDSIFQVRSSIKEQIANSSSDHRHLNDKDKKDSRVNMIRDFISGPSLNKYRILHPWNFRSLNCRLKYNCDIPKLKSTKKLGGRGTKKAKNSKRKSSLTTSPIKVYESRLEQNNNEQQIVNDDNNSCDSFNYFDESEPSQDPLDLPSLPIQEEIEEINQENMRRYPARTRKRKADVIQTSDTDDDDDDGGGGHMANTPDSYSEHEDDIDDEEEEECKRISFYKGDVIYDDDFEPSSADLEEYDKETRKKFVIRKSKSKTGNSDGNSETIDAAGDPRRSTKVIKLADPDRYSYRDYEFEEIKDVGIRCCSCELKKRFKNRRGIFGHIRHHHLNETRQHLCSICGRAFYKESQLANHTKVHEEGRGVICHLCGGKFMTESILENHIRIVHERPYDFPCTFCTEQFRSEIKLKYHIQKCHQKEPKIYVCQFCTTTCKWKENFQRHLERFHGQPLPDDIIGRRRKKYNMKKKNNEPSASATIDDRPFQCPQCIMKYRSERDLTIHIKRVHTHKNIPEMYQCQFCSNKYQTPVTLRRHEIKTHQDRPGFEWKKELRKNGWKNASFTKRPRRRDAHPGDAHQVAGQEEEEQEVEEEIVIMDEMDVDQ